MAATEILTAGLVLVRHPGLGPVRDPAPAQAPLAAGMVPLRVPRMTDTIAVEANVVSVINRTENPPPADTIIITQTLLARALPRTV